MKSMKEDIIILKEHTSNLNQSVANLPENMANLQKSVTKMEPTLLSHHELRQHSEICKRSSVLNP